VAPLLPCSMLTLWFYSLRAPRRPLPNHRGPPRRRLSRAVSKPSQRCRRISFRHSGSTSRSRLHWSSFRLSTLKLEGPPQVGFLTCCTGCVALLRMKVQPSLCESPRQACYFCRGLLRWRVFQQARPIFLQCVKCAKCSLLFTACYSRRRGGYGG
jgi:hypothetical protein